MTFDEYISRYWLLQRAVEQDEKSLALMQSESYRSFVHHFGESASPVLRAFALGENSLKEKLNRHRRLCERYATRLALAISLISVEEIRDFARLHYLYGLTHEEIAEMSFFSLRTVYRHAKRAKSELKKQLRAVSPKQKRIPPARFLVKGTLPRKKYRMDPVSKNAAKHTALRKSQPFRPVLVPF